MKIYSFEEMMEKDRNIFHRAMRKFMAYHGVKKMTAKVLMTYAKENNIYVDANANIYRKLNK